MGKKNLANKKVLVMAGATFVVYQLVITIVWGEVPIINQMTHYFLF